MTKLSDIWKPYTVEQVGWVGFWLYYRICFEEDRIDSTLYTYGEAKRICSLMNCAYRAGWMQAEVLNKCSN